MATAATAALEAASAAREAARSTGRGVNRFTGGKAGTALLIGGVAFTGWLFVTGRLGSVLAVIRLGPKALDQARGGSGIGGGVTSPTLPQFTPSLVPTLPLSPGMVIPRRGGVGEVPVLPDPRIQRDGGYRKAIRFSLPRKDGTGNPVQFDLVPGGPFCKEVVVRSAIAQGYSQQEAESIAVSVCDRGMAPAMVGGR